ncbi:penicillin acylase family protein [Chitinasiproducens palmae]|uniref:Penicillin amidase n=1 Tax=Chitinasiproducens palmae TaxID=1770053 RepID=A0A1H2PU51_9BURK|nr:penicillin acylase family protein [Chitinasiproducens palmae]SDV50702.1 penicillin amidase [Chitinasiproducens palmae]
MLWNRQVHGLRRQRPASRSRGQKRRLPLGVVSAMLNLALVGNALAAPVQSPDAAGASTPLAGAAASAPLVERAAPVDVTIKRDEFGVPHVYAATTYALFYGYGYAVAQDRLFQMEMAKRSTQGTVSEVLGEKFVKFDQSIRGNYWPASIQRQLAALPATERDILEGYAAGMNAWIARVDAEPDRLLPKQFADFGFRPGKWDAFDVAMVFVGTMANRFSDANTEIDNLALVTALQDRYGADKGMALFNQLKWLVNPDAPTTVPASEGVYPIEVGPSLSPAPGRAHAGPDAARAGRAAMQPLPRYDSAAPMLARLALGDDGALLGLDTTSNAATTLAQVARYGQTGPAGFPTTSNMWIVGKAKARGARAIMLNGPQFGWFAPAYTYGIGLHGAGFDLVGNTPFGYPCILFGHNGKVSWGSTAGLGDDVDVFAEQLDPADPNRYLHAGAWHDMEKRVETIRVKGAAPVTQQIYRTVHGIVTQRDAARHIAYAKARAWEGLEVQSLLAWTHQAQAQDWQSWTAQAAKHALTINWYYADTAGNIGYVHTGAYPARRRGHDPRLPVPGTGEWDWQGLLPFSANPKVYNPKQGWLANWNNSPEKGYPSSDAYALIWSKADRVDEIVTRITARDRLGVDDMWQILKETSAVDVNRRHFLPFIAHAATSLPSSDDRAKLAQLLAAWDGQNRDAQHAGRYDTAGPAIMDAWLAAMLKRTLGEVVPAPYANWFLATGYAAPQDGPTASANISNGSKVLYEALRGTRSSVPQRFDIFGGKRTDDVIVAALGDALDALRPTLGADLATWRAKTVPLTFRSNNFFGVPQANAGEAVRTPQYMNRGTENDLIVLGVNGAARTVAAYDVVAPGQSGFVAPDGTPSPHYADQLALYTQYGRKPLWHSQADVDRATRAIEHLRAVRLASPASPASPSPAATAGGD